MFSEVNARDTDIVRALPPVLSDDDSLAFAHFPASLLVTRDTSADCHQATFLARIFVTRPE